MPVTVGQQFDYQDYRHVLVDYLGLPQKLSDEKLETTRWVRAREELYQAHKEVTDTEKLLKEQEKTVREREIARLDAIKGGNAQEREKRRWGIVREDAHYVDLEQSLAQAEEDKRRAQSELDKATEKLKDSRAQLSGCQSLIGFYSTLAPIPMPKDEPEDEDPTEAFVGMMSDPDMMDAPESLHFVRALPEGVNPDDERVKAIQHAIANRRRVAKL